MLVLAISTDTDPLGLNLFEYMTKAAILIDGGYLLKRLPTVCPNIDNKDPVAVATSISRLVTAHLKAQNKVARAEHPRSLLYRVFYYDARPYLGKS